MAEVVYNEWAISHFWETNTIIYAVFIQKLLDSWLLRIPGTSSFFFFLIEPVDVHAFRACTPNMRQKKKKKSSSVELAFTHLPWVRVSGAMVSDTLLWAGCALIIGACLKETWLIWDSCSVYPRILTPASSWKLDFLLSLPLIPCSTSCHAQLLRVSGWGSHTSELVPVLMLQVSQPEV